MEREFQLGIVWVRLACWPVCVDYLDYMNRGEGEKHSQRVASFSMQEILNFSKAERKTLAQVHMH